MQDVNVIDERIKIFWEQCDKFKSHPLETELPNTDTHDLSDLAKTDLIKGIKAIQNVDVKAIIKMDEYSSQLQQLQNQINTVFSNNKKVLICGCGASGRLAVSIEYLWRTAGLENKRNNVVGFLAGGDNAMIKSLEGFEDIEDYGVKQLLEAGFEDGDLLISATASGESPFILAATEYASKTSIKPWFLHCNTNNALKGRIKKHVIYNPDVISLGLFVGQMALTGSTRMQATTALMLGIGLPLFSKNISDDINKLAAFVDNIDMSPLKSIIEKEANIYKNNEYIFYDTDPSYGITVLTDTTERAPTFNLAPFESQLNEKITPSWCYLLFSETDDVKQAWHQLLGREPRTLNWNKETSIEQLYGFDFSSKIIEYRNGYATPSHYFSIKKTSDKLVINFEEITAEFDISGLSFLLEQAVLKLLLNTSSTLMLGRLGYYTGNLMTSLYPSNSKLIDRTIRYIDFLVTKRSGKVIPYNSLANYMFKELKQLKPNESIVLRTVNKILEKETV